MLVYHRRGNSTQQGAYYDLGYRSDREVSWEEIAPSQVRQAMLAQGLPEDVPDRLLGYWSRLEQEPAPGPFTTAMEQILGRPALTFTQWAAEHAAAFRS